MYTYVVSLFVLCVLLFASCFFIPGCRTSHAIGLFTFMAYWMLFVLSVKCISKHHT